MHWHDWWQQEEEVVIQHRELIASFANFIDSYKWGGKHISILDFELQWIDEIINQVVE